MEENRGPGISCSFSINAQGAILNHPKFLKESKIKSALAGKEYEVWTNDEKMEFGRFIQKNVGDKMWTRIQYLASEDGFLVTHCDKMSFCFRKYGSPTNLVNEEIFDDNFMQNGLTFKLDAVIEKDVNGDYRQFFVCYLEERFDFFDEKDKYKKPVAQVLFRFPYGPTGLDDDYYKKLGFEIEHEVGHYFDNDSLGRTYISSSWDIYKQNGAEILV